ncbi:hypothetical protein WMY93_002710 [Mugilogobius chulae]|uniref:Pecanex-like protein n=1 Tax=Mugilogobius chulae TaxID=88201 RepID=A0AAW0PXC8_9GOBI
MEDKKKKKEEKKKKEIPQKCLNLPRRPVLISHQSRFSVPLPQHCLSFQFQCCQLLCTSCSWCWEQCKAADSVANGQPSSSSSPGSQVIQQQRYMSREVPPRFRCQQDHKVLLKRGQPPLSSMLLGGGGVDEAAAASGPQGEDPNAKQLEPQFYMGGRLWQPVLLSGLREDGWDGCNGLAQTCQRQWPKGRRSKITVVTITTAVPHGARQTPAEGRRRRRRNIDNSSPPSPLSPSTSLNECVQSCGIVASQPGTIASTCDGLPLHSSVISSFSASPTNSSVSQTGAHPQQQQQHMGTTLDARSLEQQQAASLKTELLDGIGPNTENGEAKHGEESTTLSSSIAAAAASSWTAIPATETGTQRKEGHSWGLDGGSNTQVVSQGVEVVCSPGEWGSTVGEGGSGHLAIGTGKGEDGSSSGGSVVTDTASPKLATMSKAWDNQKGAESDNDKVGEWGVGGSKGEGSTAGSSGGGQKTDRSGHRQSHQINADVALQSMLNRSDLDPRVLSNTGWGQTQIRQNVAWNLNTPSRNDKSTSLSSASINTSTSHGANNPGSSLLREGWDAVRASHEVESEQGKAEGAGVHGALKPRAKDGEVKSSGMMAKQGVNGVK